MSNHHLFIICIYIDFLNNLTKCIISIYDEYNLLMAVNKHFKILKAT